MGEYCSLRILPPPEDAKAGQHVHDGGPMIDVRGARFGEVEFLGIAPRDALYDREVGGVVSRRVLGEAGWPIRGDVSEYFGGIVHKFKLYGGDEGIYVVPTLAPDAHVLMAEFRELKKRGWIT